MAHDELQLSARPSPNRHLRSCTGRCTGIARTRLESWSRVCRTDARKDLVRRAAGQSLVGPVQVVPSGVAVADHEHGAKRQRNESASWAEGFALQRVPEALHAGDGAVLADGAVAGLDAVSLAPRPVAQLELHAMVGDGVLRRDAGPAARPIEQAASLLGSGLLDEDADGKHAAEKWSRTTESQKQKGQTGIMDLGNHGTQKPMPVGRMEWSMPQT